MSTYPNNIFNIQTYHQQNNKMTANFRVILFCYFLCFFYKKNHFMSTLFELNFDSTYSLSEEESFRQNNS